MCVSDESDQVNVECKYCGYRREFVFGSVSNDHRIKHIEKNGFKWRSLFAAGPSHWYCDKCVRKIERRDSEFWVRRIGKIDLPDDDWAVPSDRAEMRAFHDAGGRCPNCLDTHKMRIFDHGMARKILCFCQIGLTI